MEQRTAFPPPLDGGEQLKVFLRGVIQYQVIFYVVPQNIIYVTKPVLLRLLHVTQNRSRCAFHRRMSVKINFFPVIEKLSYKTRGSVYQEIIGRKMVYAAPGSPPRKCLHKSAFLQLFTYDHFPEIKSRYLIEKGLFVIRLCDTKLAR